MSMKHSPDEVERVARALCRHHSQGGLGPDDTICGEPYWRTYISAARAALEAMEGVDDPAALLREARRTTEAILRFAAPHPDDTERDRKVLLAHIEAKANALLAKLNGDAP